jgi:hypothetical protein
MFNTLKQKNMKLVAKIIFLAIWIVILLLISG